MPGPAVGIDLGTTFSALAAINPAGRPEIVPNSDGERLTASAVFFQPDGSLLVGSEAVAAAAAHPERVVRWVKRRVGQESWQAGVDGKAWNAVEISTLILKRLKQDAERSLGPIRHAVVTVPAYFDEERRKATMDAAAEAGLELLRIINEPTAAAIAHASAGRISGNCLVYDLGGGTFDVSVVSIRSPQDVEVLSSDGDHQLGGLNFDQVLAGQFDARFRAETGGSLQGDAACMHQVLQLAEAAKKSLAKRSEVGGIGLSWQGKSVTTSVTKADFEAWCEELVLRTEMLVDNALMDASLAPEQIDAVLLVGGSTRLTAVQSMLRRKFNKEPQASVNVDEAVALGAAIQAGVLMQEKGLIELPAPAMASLAATRIRDVTNHSYGTLSLETVHGAERLRNVVLIPKNTPIPATVTKVFYTVAPDQREIECSITQGEDEDREFVRRVCQGTMALPPGRPANCPIEVTYSYDANQRMRCVFKDLQSGQTVPFDLDHSQSRARTSAFGDLTAEEGVLDDLLVKT